MFKSQPKSILRGICGAAFAQTPPTATEAFNLRIRCKEMADKKAENFYCTNPLRGRRAIAVMTNTGRESPAQLRPSGARSGCKFLVIAASAAHDGKL